MPLDALPTQLCEATLEARDCVLVRYGSRTLTVRLMAYWYDLCSGREKAPVHDKAAVVGLAATCPALCVAPLARQRLCCLPPLTLIRRKMFLSKGELYFKVRASHYGLSWR